MFILKFDLGWILINDNYILVLVKKFIYYFSIDYIDDFVDDIFGMFNIYEIIILIYVF